MSGPYYQDDRITLWHGDCLEHPEWWTGADVLVTDPPYGMDYTPLRGSDGSKLWGKAKVAGDAEPFDPAHLLGHRAVLFGANWYASRLPDSGGWIVWDKTPRGQKSGFTASHAELAWTNVASRVWKFSLQWGGEARNGEGHYHPTQKPVGIMRQIIETFTSVDDVVGDPYAGSGTTLLAARESGRRAVGVELEERYCEIAVRRLSQEVFDFGSLA